MGTPKDYWKNVSGKKFGKWTVLKPVYMPKIGRTMMECQCECGTVGNVFYTNLKRNTSSCCGCSRFKSKKSVIKRLFDNRFIDDNGCWNWTGGCAKTGYFKTNFNGYHWLGHRLSYTLFIKTIDDNAYICHKCDNRRCFNPDHLYEGNAKTNVRDMLNRGRHISSPGSLNGRSKISESVVYSMRSMYKVLKNTAKIARIHGVNPRTAHAVIKREIWKHI